MIRQCADAELLTDYWSLNPLQPGIFDTKPRVFHEYKYDPQICIKRRHWKIDENFGKCLFSED